MSFTTELSQLEAAVAAQEALRPTLGDAVVDTTLAVLRAQLERLRTDASPDDLIHRLRSYLPRELAEKMRATGRLEGERKQVTVMFTDLSGFTALSETLDPEEVANLTNEALKELAEAVYQHEGYIDKFVGDAVMAVFGAPVAHEDDPDRALRITLSMRERMEAFNRRWAERLGQSVLLHIGVNTGTVIAQGLSKVEGCAAEFGLCQARRRKSCSNWHLPTARNSLPQSVKGFWKGPVSSPAMSARTCAFPTP